MFSRPAHRRWGPDQALPARPTAPCLDAAAPLSLIRGSRWPARAALMSECSQCSQTDRTWPLWGPACTRPLTAGQRKHPSCPGPSPP